MYVMCINVNNNYFLYTVQVMILREPRIYSVYTGSIQLWLLGSSIYTESTQCIHIFVFGIVYCIHILKCFSRIFHYATWSKGSQLTEVYSLLYVQLPAFSACIGSGWGGWGYKGWIKGGGGLRGVEVTTRGGGTGALKV